jgi:hypothetical protein
VLVDNGSGGSDSLDASRQWRWRWRWCGFRLQLQLPLPLPLLLPASGDDETSFVVVVVVGGVYSILVNVSKRMNNIKKTYVIAQTTCHVVRACLHHAVVVS